MRKIKNIVSVCILVLLFISIKEQLFNKSELNAVENNEVVVQEEYHNWNDENYSLSSQDISDRFDAYINENEKLGIVVFYDGGECNPYLDNVIEQLERYDGCNKLLVTNKRQSNIDVSYDGEVSSTDILGDENRSLSKMLSIYDYDTDRMSNIILIFENGEVKESYKYTPSKNEELYKIISQY